MLDKQPRLFKSRLVIPAKAGIYNQTGIGWLVCRNFAMTRCGSRVRGDDGLSSVLTFEQTCDKNRRHENISPISHSPIAEGA